MISYEFRDGDQIIDLNNDPASAFCRKILSIINASIESVECTIHGDSRHATITIDLSQEILEWEVESACCDSFAERIEDAMPFPWNGAVHHLQP